MVAPTTVRGIALEIKFRLAQETRDQSHRIQAKGVVWCGEDETIMSLGEDTNFLGSVTSGTVLDAHGYSSRPFVIWG